MSKPARRVDFLAAGVVSTFGAGLFIGLAPAASLAGRWLLLAFVASAVIAYLTVLSTSERPLDTVPEPLRRLAFAVGALGRLAAAVAIAGTFGRYAVPSSPAFGAVVLVAAVTVLVVVAPRPPAVVVRLAAVTVVGGLALVAAACFAIAPVAPAVATSDGGSVLGFVACVGLLSVCFLGGAPASRPVVDVQLPPMPGSPEETGDVPLVRSEGLSAGGRAEVGLSVDGDPGVGGPAVPGGPGDGRESPGVGRVGEASLAKGGRLPAGGRADVRLPGDGDPGVGDLGGGDPVEAGGPGDGRPGDVPVAKGRRLPVGRADVRPPADSGPGGGDPVEPDGPGDGRESPVVGRTGDVPLAKGAGSPAGERADVRLPADGDPAAGDPAAGDLGSGTPAEGEAGSFAAGERGPGSSAAGEYEAGLPAAGERGLGSSAAGEQGAGLSAVGERGLGSSAAGEQGAGLSAVGERRAGLSAGGGGEARVSGGVQRGDSRVEGEGDLPAGRRGFGLPDRRGRRDRLVVGGGRLGVVAVMGVVLVVCLAVGAGVLRQLGAARLAVSPVPLRDALAAADAAALGPLLVVGVGVATGFGLFGIVRGLVVGVSVPVVRVRVAAGLVVAIGAVVVAPEAALGAAAVLLLGDAVLRVVAVRHRRLG